MNPDAANAVEQLYSSRGSRQIRFAAVGDVMVDKTVHVERLSRQLSLGDGTFLRSRSVEVALGGVPTVARVLAEVGRTTMIRPRFNRGTELHTLDRLLGEDPKLAAVDSLEVDCQDWVVPSVIRYLEPDFLRRDHQLFRVEERSERFPAIDAAAIASRLVQDSFETLVVSDYGRGFITEALCAAIKTAAPHRIILDPAGHWSAYRELGPVHTVLIRSDQLADLCLHEGMEIDAASSLDLRSGAICVFQTWSGIQNLVIKDHGTAQTTLFSSRTDGGERVADVFVLRKKTTNLRNRLGGGTAFTACMTAALGIGLDILSAALVGECGALAMSLSDHPGVPCLDEVHRFRELTADLFVVDRLGSETIAPLSPKRDYL